MATNEWGQVTASLFKDERATFERIEKFISPHHFIDYNLRGRLYGQNAPVTLTHADCGQDRVSFADAKTKLDNDGKPVDVGFVLGPAWSTHWFKVSFQVPDAWKGKEVNLRWDSGSEAMVWSLDGSPVQGLSSEFNRTDVPLDASLLAGLFLEVAANELFGAGDGGMIRPPNPNKTFPIKTAQIAVFNRHIYQVLMDFDILLAMAQLLPTTSQRRYQALYMGNHMINTIVADDFSPAALAKAHEMAKSLFNEKNGDGQLTIYAMGNCHIDTAWLWTYDETKRKCARSWSSTLRLMERYPKLNFAVSQAQQIVWLRDKYPQLYERIVEKAREGRFFGVGGSWIEMDGNLPSGESFVRQLLYGQREFQKVFGRTSDTFWLPDTFGYSAQFPQIMQAAGMTRFVTQKMSWSLINKFPHSSFWWQGIDGSKVLAHFPPHHYCAEITVKECLETAENFRDKGRNNGAMMLYGHGDGGGGPTADILERLDRLADCDGIPKVVAATPTEFFEQLEKDGDSLCLWSGELFLELHNATYTTQSDVKKMNRMCEFLLRDQEFVQAIRFVQSGKFRTMEAEWKSVLLNQFHDVLPGTSIADVYFDAKNIYRQVYATLLTAPDTLRSFADQSNESGQRRIVNSLSWARTIEQDGRFYKLAPSSIQSLDVSLIEPDDQARACHYGDYIVLENKFLRAHVDQIGRIVSLRLKTASGGHAKFDTVAQDECLNQFVIYDDVPLYWDAWDCMDYHLETKRTIVDAAVNEAGEPSTATITKSGPAVAEVVFALRIGDESSLRQTIKLKADCPYLEFTTTVDWNEKHKLLKVDFAVGVRAPEAWYDIQFGHVKRPTHRNTSWDAAKYEVCGHKWTALTEFDHGVAILNDSKYGHSCHDNILSMSLLRAAKSPDDHADMGKHEFAYAIFPFTGTLQQPTNCDLNVIRAAYEFNMPARFVDCWNTDCVEFIQVADADGVIVESVKVSEKGDSLVVRLFEAFGGRTTATIRPSAPVTKAYLSDGLESQRQPLDLNVSDRSFTLPFTPFQIQTVLLFLNN